MESLWYYSHVRNDNRSYFCLSWYHILLMSSASYMHFSIVFSVFFLNTLCDKDFLLSMWSSVVCWLVISGLLYGIVLSVSSLWCVFICRIISMSLCCVWRCYVFWYTYSIFASMLDSAPIRSIVSISCWNSLHRSVGVFGSLTMFSILPDVHCLFLHGYHESFFFAIYISFL